MQYNLSATVELEITRKGTLLGRAWALGGKVPQGRPPRVECRKSRGGGGRKAAGALDGGEKGTGAKKNTIHQKHK